MTFIITHKKDGEEVVTTTEKEIWYQGEGMPCLVADLGQDGLVYIPKKDIISIEEI